jgi:hypothetical protein
MNEGHFYADTSGESDDDEGGRGLEGASHYVPRGGYVLMTLALLDESMMIATAAAINIY